MDEQNTRESERSEWWRPRAVEICRFITTELTNSDVILLQEYWLGEEFEKLFDSMTSHLFHRVSERRPKDSHLMRDDGMAVLVNKRGRLTLMQSKSIRTGPQRISQFVQCREKDTGRIVHVINAHLSFPGSSNIIKDERRQAMEVLLSVRALMREGRHSSKPPDLEIFGGDFNSNSRGLASTYMDKLKFVSCANAMAMQSFLSGSGGRIGLGVTHRTHRGEDVSVDHIFLRLGSSYLNKRDEVPYSRAGYLDDQGTRISDCSKKNLILLGQLVISDHRPVTATLEWPKPEIDPLVNGDLYFMNLPWSPFEPPWGDVDGFVKF